MMTLTRIPPALLALAALSPLMADTNFRIRRTNRDDIPLGKGQCDIRLQVDNEVEVAVRRDLVSIRTISGRDAYDDGSECNAPLPDREMPGFQFEVKDSRGEIRLLSEPNRRNDFAAVVLIRDSPGGFGRYHFRISWTMTGPGDFRRDTDRPPNFRRDNDRPSDRRDNDRPDFRRDNDRPPGAFTWNNVMHFSGRGRGESSLAGVGSQRLFDASVDIDRGGRIQVVFRTDSGRPLTFTGTVIGRDGDNVKADVTADERLLRLRGPMILSIDPAQNIYRIWLEAVNGRDRLRLDWDRERR
jgi:hypothetical protein